MGTLDISHDIPEPIAEKFTDKNILKQIQTAMKKAGFDQDNHIATWLP